MADWPTARGDAGRTGTTASGPIGPLFPAWTIRTPAPAPAWTGEARGSLWQNLAKPLTPRAADDLAPVPILVKDVVLFATTHDEVRCVERTHGRTRWRYHCGGPVRYAPTAAGDSVIVGSDDGLIHALDLQTGARHWTTRIGPDSPLIAGNGRLISPCPVRTGLVVQDGVVYAAAGLFPIEGAYLAAIDAGDGHLLWRRNLGNASPQGYLVDAGTEVIVPFGRAVPKVYRKQDGIHTRDIPSTSGTFAVVAQDETLSGPGATGMIQGAKSPGRHSGPDANKRPELR